MYLAQLIYRLATDPRFAHLLLEAPTTALEAAGVELSGDERVALLAVLRQSTQKSKTEFNGVRIQEMTDWYPVRLT